MLMMESDVRSILLGEKCRDKGKDGSNTSLDPPSRHDFTTIGTPIRVLEPISVVSRVFGCHGNNNGTEILYTRERRHSTE